MEKPIIYKVKGMHCASCAGIIEKTFRKTNGVTSAEVNYGTETAKVSFDDTKVTPQELSKSIEQFGYSLIVPTIEDMIMSSDEHVTHVGLHQSKKEKLEELASMKRQIISAVPLAVFSIMVMAWDVLAVYGFIPQMGNMIKGFIHHLLPIFATYMLFVVGKPYLLGFYRFLRYGAANMDTLIGIGTSVAFVYSFIISAFEEMLRPYLNVEYTYYDVTIVVIAFIALGKYLEARSKLKTGDAIEKLLNLQAKTAIVLRNGKEIEISINEVAHGDVIIIKPGSKIPVDGIIIEGGSYIDESMVTGEPIPVAKKHGDTVVSGTINTTGLFTFKATKVGSETFLAQVIKMVEEAQGSKAPIQALADKISAVFVPVVLILALFSFIGWMFLGIGPLGFSQALSYGLLSFVSVLVIACPCALGLATPTAIIVGVGKGAKEGILIKDAATLEELYKVNTIVVDKTGTITKGKPVLVDIENNSGLSNEEFISLLASLEKSSEHPIAHAVVKYAEEKNITMQAVSNFSIVEGKGLKGNIGDTEYFVGNMQFMRDINLSFDDSHIEKYTVQGKTPLIIATKEKVFGFATVSDEIKGFAKEAITSLHKLGVRVIMLTGDDERAAKYIASLVGIDEVIAHVLPQDKLAKVKDLQSKGYIVAMAGDGVNDAPALAQANVGIAMGTGTDVAIESAGITLLGGDISKIAKAIKLSKITMLGIKQNLFWAFFYNIVGIPLASGILFPFFGWLLSPVFAGLAMAMSSVSVVSNSLRIKVKTL